MSLDYEVNATLDQPWLDDESSKSFEVAAPHVYHAEDFLATFFSSLELEDSRLSVAMLDLPLRSPYKSTRPERKGLR